MWREAMVIVCPQALIGSRGVLPHGMEIQWRRVRPERSPLYVVEIASIDEDRGSVHGNRQISRASATAAPGD